jgi:hypothetical protein
VAERLVKLRRPKCRLSAADWIGIVEKRRGGTESHFTRRLCLQASPNIFRQVRRLFNSEPFENAFLLAFGRRVPVNKVGE